MIVQTYKEKKFDLKGLNGISDEQLEQHFELYSGYVRNTNLLNEHISDLIENDNGDTPEFAELVRRLGFEYNGMRLHEYYFGNLKAGASPEPLPDSRLRQTIESYFGNFDDWKKAFISIGKMRGVGWAILYQDPVAGRLSNHWITLHEDGHPAGFAPILVMDVWEHAYMVDYKASERAEYIEAFFSNIDWGAVESRLITAGAAAA